MGQQTQLSDFVGNYGSYQTFITILLFVRYFLLGLMATSGTLLAPDVTFYCDLPRDEIIAIRPNITQLSLQEQEQEIREDLKKVCQLDFHLYQNQLNISTTTTTTNNQSRYRECDQFKYDKIPDQGRTLTSEFDLVCERETLRQIFQSLVSGSIVVGHVFWGTFSDRYGRFASQKLCLFISLVSGFVSIFSMDFWTFTILRSLCSFGDLGVVMSLTTSVVELVGNEYRGFSVALANFGYALAVSIVPYIVSYFEDFRLVVSFSVFCHILTIPFFMTTNESVRWLLTNRRFNKAEQELKRIQAWNSNWKRFRNYTFDMISIGRLCRQPEQSSIKHEHKINQNQAASEFDAKQFDIRFDQLIEQLESQNLYDPENRPEAGLDLIPTSDQSADSNNSQHQPQKQPAKVKQASKNNHHNFGGHKSLRYSLDSQFKSMSSIISENNLDKKSLSIYESLKSLDIEIDSLSLKDCDVDDFKSAKFELTTELNENNPEQSAKQTCKTHRYGQKNNTHSIAIIDYSGIEVDETTFDSKGAPKYYHYSENSIISANNQSGFQPIRARSSAARNELCHQPDCINMVANQLSFMGRVNQLFRDKRFMIATFTIVWTTFNSELQYMSFIIINLEVGEDMYLNFILGGCMEALAAIFASLLLSYAPRRASLIASWLLISLSCFGLSLAHIDSHWAVWLLALAKFSQSCLSTIASVAAYESFPTFLRQSGSGLVLTLGMLGSVFAPLICAEFDDHAGMDGVLMVFSFNALVAALLIQLFLIETKDCELK